MNCNSCQNYSGCSLPWKGSIVEAGSCGQYRKGKQLTDVCHYCNKPNPEDVDGGFFAHMNWELHDKPNNQHVYKVICKSCYEKVLGAYRGMYVRTILKLYEIILGEQSDMKIKVLQELLEKNVCGICMPEGKAGCADTSCDIYKAIKETE